MGSACWPLLCFGAGRRQIPSRRWVGPSLKIVPRPIVRIEKLKTIGWQMMTERITHSSVTFRHAFVLREVEGVQPPGTYLIETVEEPLDNLSFLAYRRVSTTITLPAVG